VPLHLPEGDKGEKLKARTDGAEWTPFQTHYFSKSMVAPEIEL
jgi:hypothetical protein